MCAGGCGYWERVRSKDIYILVSLMCMHGVKFIHILMCLPVAKILSVVDVCGSLAPGPTDITQPPQTGMALCVFPIFLDIIAALLGIISQDLGYSLQNCIIRTWENIPQACQSLCKGRKLFKSELRDSETGNLGNLHFIYSLQHYTLLSLDPHYTWRCLHGTPYIFSIVKCEYMVRSYGKDIKRLWMSDRIRFES